jgi:hypothetical protein
MRTLPDSSRRNHRPAPADVRSPTAFAGPRSWRIVLAGLCLAALGGCGKESVLLEGTVSYDGKPVAEGSISLYPVNSQGPVCGGEIRDGRYRVENLVPGMKRVQIAAADQSPFATSSAELQEMSKSRPAIAPGGLDLPILRAIGNNVQIEVTVGRQTHDFKLMPR